MPKRPTAPAPTDEEILRYDDVPTPIAARYIGMSVTTLCRALREERVFFGFAAHNPDTDSWSYNISPGGLVKYKREGGQVIKLGELHTIIVDSVEQILSAKLGGLQKILEAVLAA